MELAWTGKLIPKVHCTLVIFKKGRRKWLNGDDGRVLHASWLKKIRLYRYVGEVVMRTYLYVRYIRVRNKGGREGSDPRKV